jgi:SAM-dependent methyltransferase
MNMRRFLRVRKGESIPVGAVRFGDLRRLSPLSKEFGYDRGQPVDRYYIERFLERHSEDIQGRVLEIADDGYTRRFGGGRVISSDVLHVSERGPGVTIVGDLSAADTLPEAAFDCIILTQTMQVIYDLRAALVSVHRSLRSGGVVLATVPGISPVSRYDMERWGYYWSFTTQSVTRLFEEVFGADLIQVESHGNVLAATAFLHGLAGRELRAHELDYHDEDYQLIITIRAAKAAE